MRAAHDAAVAAALEYLEAEVVRTRRGRDGVEVVGTRGLVAAAFVHRTSRAGDPLLHTHVVIANSVQALDDGMWRTLDSRRLYRHVKTAGYLYQAQLRAELSRQLGLEWEPVVNGCADLVGIPRRVVEAFSQRRAAIVAALAERGESSAAAAQVATLATRQPKRHDIGVHELRAEWQMRAEALGLTRELLARVVHRRAWAPPTREAVEAAAQQLVGPEGLTHQASTFTRRDVIRGWCEQLPAGVDVGHVRALADWLTSPATGAVVALDHPLAVAARRGDQAGMPARRDEAERRWSTPELLQLEAAALASTLARQHDQLAIVGDAALGQALSERPSLSDEQAAMVERITRSGAGVEVVVGKAGTGKSFSLDAARAAWEASGVQVSGCALAARTAAELEASAGIPSTTLARATRDLAVWSLRSPASRPSRVLVIDEAAMVGTRQLAQLLDLSATAGVKVVLVGDHHQLPAIEAGGLFHALANRLPSVELTHNRRQQQPWERDALDQLRHGEPTLALHAYNEHGRIITSNNAERLRDQLVDDWHAAQSSGKSALMIAASRADVADLNQRARARLARAGPVKGPALQTAAGREFQVGDRVIAGRNRHRLGLLNGTRGTVTAIDHDSGRLTVTVDGSERVISIDADYLDAGHLDHAYAVTCHKAQGATIDATFTLGSDRLYRELAYVALSRGRDSNTLYTLAGTDLARGLEQSRQQELALEWAR